MKFPLREGLLVVAFAFAALVLLAIGPVDGMNLVEDLVKGLITVVGIFAGVLVVLIEVLFVVLNVFFTVVGTLLNAFASVISAVL